MSHFERGRAKMMTSGVNKLTPFQPEERMQTLAEPATGDGGYLVSFESIGPLATICLSK
jgi:hypothetical protein